MMKITLGERFIKEFGDKFRDEYTGKAEDFTIDYLENVPVVELDLAYSEYDDGSRDYYFQDTGELAFIIG